MKALKKILISLLVIAVLLVVVSFFLPSHYAVKRTVTVNAPMDQVVAQVNNFENWKNWSPWAEKDSTIVNTFEGDINGDSYTMSWTSKESGIGSMTREEATMQEASSSLKYKLAFTEPFESSSTNTFLFEKAEDGVQVTWSDEGEMGNNPIAKYMGLFMDGMIGPDFERGLENLKKYIEDPANQKTKEPEKMQVNGHDAELIQIESFKVLGIRKQLTMAEISDSTSFATNYGKLGAYCEKNGVTMIGAPSAIYYTFDKEKDLVDVTFAFPVGPETVAPAEGEEIQLVEVPASQALQITYVGPYDQVGPTWDAAELWIKDMGMDYAWAAWETYVSDPANTPANELITKITIPVREASKDANLEGDTGE